MTYDPTDRTDDSSRPRPCTDCPDDNDDCHSPDVLNFKCAAEALAAKNAVYEQHKQDLETARQTAATAPPLYRAKRTELALQIQGMRHDLKCLVGQLACMIQHKHVVEFLDEAFGCVKEQLHGCEKHSRTKLICCDDSESECAPDCRPVEGRTIEQLVEFLSELNRKQLVQEKDLVARKQAEYAEQVELWKAWFGTLAGETESLQQRADAEKEAIDKIKDGLKSTAGNPDLKHLYAEALVEQYRMETITHGIDSTGEYVEKLCRALKCWTRYVEGLAYVTGVQTKIDCIEADVKADCDDLRANTVDRLIVLFEKRYPKPSCDDLDADDACAEQPHGHDHPHRHGAGSY